MLGLPAGGLKIGGHTIPWPAVGAVAAVASVLLVLRARSTGGQVVSAGTPAAAADTSGGSVFGLDQEAQLANLSQQLTNLQQSLAGTAAATTSSTSSTTTQPSPLATALRNLGSPANRLQPTVPGPGSTTVAGVTYSPIPMGSFGGWIAPGNVPSN